ncbi:MAG TPA: hypothetical protein DCS42_00410 [Nitrospiraceae bacterium]|nr:hypothetical protein [Nitrospiraceae bacterium]
MGELIIIHGPAGSGKTSLAGIISGSQGRIRVFDGLWSPAAVKHSLSINNSVVIVSVDGPEHILPHIVGVGLAISDVQVVECKLVPFALPEKENWLKRNLRRFV